MLQYSLETSITKQSAFWFNTAILFYSATMFLLMALINYYAEHAWGYDILFYIWGTNFILFYALIAAALLVDKKEYEPKKWEMTTSDL